jgi:hypothetical protein
MNFIVKFNCSLSSGATLFTMHLPVLGQGGTAFSPLAWTWALKTFPQKPGEPSVTSSAKDGAVQLDWDVPPGFGSPVFVYTVNFSDSSNSNKGGAVVVPPPDAIAMSYLVTGLKNGVAYTFTVNATNSAGFSIGTTNATPQGQTSSLVLLGILIVILIAISMFCVRRCHRRLKELEFSVGGDFDEEDAEILDNVTNYKPPAVVYEAPNAQPQVSSSLSFGSQNNPMQSNDANELQNRLALLMKK